MRTAFDFGLAELHSGAEAKAHATARSGTKHRSYPGTSFEGIASQSDACGCTRRRFEAHISADSDGVAS
jgi:hypothetical protein